MISIVGILATATITLINPAQQIKRGNDGRRKAELKQIQSGLELYRADVGGYPIDNYSGTANSVGNTLVNPTDNSIVYLQSVPKDPKISSNYFYCTQTTCGAPTDCASSPCASYALYACSELGVADSQAATPLPSGMSCGTLSTSYYYKVLSP